MKDSFLMEEIQKKVDELIKEISEEKNLLIKKEKYQSLLELNNTNKTYILDYLSLLQKCVENKMVSEDELKKELELYINAIPKNEFNNKFQKFKIKEKSSFENIKIFLEKIKNYNFKCDKIKDKSNEYKFIEEFINKYSEKINCNSPITYDNSELYIFSLFHSYLSSLSQKIEYYKNTEIVKEEKSEDLKKVEKLIEDIKNNYQKFQSVENIQNAKKLLDKAENNRKFIVLLEGDFIKSYLTNFKSFIDEIYDNFIEKFENCNFDKANINLLEKFMLFISEFDFEDLTYTYSLVWKYTFKDITHDKKLEIIKKLSEEEPKFTLSFTNENELEINKNLKIPNINDYIFESFCRAIRFISSFNENLYLEYVKISELENHLYIKKVWENFKQLNINIFHSKAIQSLYKILFNEQHNFLLDQKEMSIIFDNVDFILYPTSFRGTTFRNILKIFENASMLNLKKKADLSKILFLSGLIDTNEHEILGHFNISYQNYLNKPKKYDSPIPDKNQSSGYAKDRGKESGENIEIKLYGRVIYELTLKEAIYIIDIRNYLYDFNEFRNNFRKCNDKNLIIDDFLKSYLENSFNINVNNLPKDDKTSYKLTNATKANNNFIDNAYSIGLKHPPFFDMDGSKIESKFEEFKEFEKEFS